MKNLTEINLEKSRSGVYKDNEENRRLHRVGQRYGEPKKEEISSESRKSDLEELKQDMLQAEKELKAHNKRRSLYASYTKGEENWSRTKAKLEQKLDTLQQEYKRRFAEVNKKPEEKKPNKVKIEGKTFRVEDGKIVASMLDNQSRIRKIMKFAAENGYKVAWEESKTVQKPDLKHSDSSEGKSEVKYEDYEGEDEDGELVTFTYDKDKFDRYKLYIWLKAARLKRGTDPNLSKLGYLKNSGDLNKKAIEKFFELKKEFGDGRRYDFKEKNREDEMKGKPEQKPVEQSSSDEGVFTRVSFQDIPNAHKVNLKKYLSAKRKTAVDEAWSKAKFDSVSREKAGVFQEGYNKLREQFNNNFDSMSKAERAELLYKILKMKNAIERK